MSTPEPSEATAPLEAIAPLKDDWVICALNSLGDAMIAADHNARITFMNPVAESITGWKSADALGKDITEVYNAVDEATGQAMKRLLTDIAQGIAIPAEKINLLLVTPGGMQTPVEDTASTIRDNEGTPIGVVVLFRDVTEQREAQRILETLNERMRQNAMETHHRIKNHLQIVAALIDIQAKDNEEGLSPDAVLKLGLHIRTLAQIHELLTEASQKSEDTANISAHKTLSKLIPLIQATVMHRTVHYLGLEVQLPTRMSATLALVVNELISNSLKYSKGAIEVNLTKKGRQIRLVVSDDGPGFPDNIALHRPGGMGLSLVESMVREDLQGEALFENQEGGGACVTITFSLP